jgi:hypothetical protein
MNREKEERPLFDRALMVDVEKVEDHVALLPATRLRLTFKAGQSFGVAGTPR